MRPAESFVGQPIRSLQTMLRVIAQADETMLSVIPDGIYGNNTMMAVSNYQRQKGLPATGIADQVTWNAIVADYEPALILVGESKAIEVVWEPNQVVKLGQRHPNMFLAQGMLIVLSQVYDSVTPPGMSGTLDIPTSQSISSFQALSQLPETGELDRITWQQLATQYPLAARLVLEKNME